MIDDNLSIDYYSLDVAAGGVVDKVFDRIDDREIVRLGQIDKHQVGFGTGLDLTQIGPAQSASASYSGCIKCLGRGRRANAFQFYFAQNGGHPYGLGDVTRVRISAQRYIDSSLQILPERPNDGLASFAVGTMHYR